MTKNIKFDKAAADRVIIEMCRYGRCVLIIGRPLNRREKMHIHIARYDHDAGRVLSRRTLYTHASCSKIRNIGIMFLDAFFLKKLLHIAKSRFICKAPVAMSPRPQKSLSPSEICSFS